MHKRLIDLPEKNGNGSSGGAPVPGGDGAACFDVCQRNNAHLAQFEGDFVDHYRM